MSIEADLKSQQIAAMKAKDSATADVIKMIRTKVSERRTSKGFTGEVDDALYVEVIAAYKKSLEKARVEFEKVGERGAQSVAELDGEIAYCMKFLPSLMSEDEIRSVVKELVAGMSSVNLAMSGRIVGMVMKEHKGRADAATVKTVVEQALAG